MDFEDVTRALCSATGSKLAIDPSLKNQTSAKKSKSPMLLVGPDARVANVEKKIDNLAQQMEEMILVIKNWQAGP